MPQIAYQDTIVNFGLSGLDLRHPPELVPPGKYTRLNNVTRMLEGAWRGRPGQTTLFTLPVALDIHTVARLNNVPTGTFTRLAGAGTALYSGVSGAFTAVVNPFGAFSGDPLTIVPLRPPLSGDAWGYIGDSAVMLKVRATDSLVAEIGLSKALDVGGRFRIDEFARIPDGSLSGADRTRFSCFGFDIAAGTGGDSPLAQLTTEKTKTIDTCEVAGWTNNTGTGAGAPANAVDAVEKKAGAGSLKLTTDGGANAYYQFWSKAIPLNLSVFSDVDSTPATDDDIIHLWLKAERPDLISEFRIYFVISTPFDTGTVPGTSATLNTDAYMKTIRPADFTDLYENTALTLGAASGVNSTADILARLTGISDDRSGLPDLIKQQKEAKRARSLEMAPGRNQWTELGAVGSALYRGDFRRIGSDQAKGWGDITGIVLLVQGKSADWSIWLDDIYMRGGYGPDTTPIGSQSYDYRYRNYDPRTGVKGNPSATQSGRFALDPARQAVRLTPLAYGDSAIRQQFFRRGGGLVSNWYFLGTNASDGASFLDIFSDDAVKSAPILDIDNDRPITTTDRDGNTVYEQPLASIWGPVLELLMGCGDPHRPGHVSWSKSGEYDHWPVNNNAEVCAPSEELMAGCVFLGQGYVFSRKRLFNCYVNLAGGGIVTPTPTPCLHGLVSRWGLCVALDGIYFVSNDGIYKTSGGIEVSCTDDDLYPLFHGEAAHGYLPIDFTHPEVIRLEAHQNEIWFLYRDTGGTNRVLVYSILQQFWRAYNFGREISSLHSEQETEDNSIMVFGGRADNDGYQHSGITDDGLPIAGQIRTGCLDQGNRRAEKSYGDIVLDYDGGAPQAIIVTPYVNGEATALLAQGVAVAAGRTRKTLDPVDAALAPGPYLARDIAIDISWSISAAPPSFYNVDVSYIILPDDTTTRVTEWDNAGTPSDKWMKGIILDIDTGGVAKTIGIEADGVAATSFSVTTARRAVVEISWPRFRGRLIRLRPTGDESFKLYGLRWIHDEEPYALTRWESEELDFGLSAPGGFSILYANIAIAATAPVTLEVVMTDVDGGGGTTSLFPPALSPVGAAKAIIFVPFEVNTGVFSRWIFTSEEPFYLYREESEVAVQPWGGQLTLTKPFGNDDLDPVRGMVSSESASARSGASGLSKGR